MESSKTKKKGQRTSPAPSATATASAASASGNATLMKKPMRPLTAYHIFFQIEREYIIQKKAAAEGGGGGGVDDDGKSYQPDVPSRYRRVKLLPNWYAGPGKRKKRKHRKSHGVIGFRELSSAISKRWATLESTDPETKAYVARVAARELDEYKVEMREFKEYEDRTSSSSAKQGSNSAKGYSVIAFAASSKLPPIRSDGDSKRSAAAAPANPSSRQQSGFNRDFARSNSLDVMAAAANAVENGKSENRSEDAPPVDVSASQEAVEETESQVVSFLSGRFSNGHNTKTAGI